MWKYFEKYVDRIYGWAVKHTYTSDEAEELSQEIFLRAMTSFRGFATRAALSRGFGGSPKTYGTASADIAEDCARSEYTLARL